MRFIDEPPRFCNEDLAAFMRCISICAEHGSGIDKVIKVLLMQRENESV